MILKLEKLIRTGVITLAVAFCFAHNVSFVYGVDGLHVKTGGNVGIGTTSPGTKLSVDGNITLPEGSAIYSDNGGGFSASGRMVYRDPTTDIVHIGSPNYGNALYIDPYGNYTGAPVVINPVGGNVGIGTANPPMKFYVNGSAGGTTIWSASDRSWKKDIKTITKALNGIMKIRGVQYKWKNGSVDRTTGFDDKTHYGVIAQEVEAVFPYLVSNFSEPKNRKKEDKLDGHYKEGRHDGKYVEYNALLGILIEAVKELKTENDTVTAKNEQLRNALTSLTDRQTALEEMFLAISTTHPNEKLAKLDNVLDE